MNDLQMLSTRGFDAVLLYCYYLDGFSFSTVFYATTAECRAVAKIKMFAARVSEPMQSKPGCAQRPNVIRAKCSASALAPLFQNSVPRSLSFAISSSLARR